MMDEKTLLKKTVADLKHIASENGIAIPSGIRKADLMRLILEIPSPKEEAVVIKQDQREENTERTDEKTQNTVPSVEFKRPLSTQQRMGARTQPVQNSFRNAGRVSSGKSSNEVKPRTSGQSYKKKTQTDGTREKSARPLQQENENQFTERKEKEQRNSVTVQRSNSTSDDNTVAAKNKSMEAPAARESFAGGDFGEGEGILEIHPDGYGFLRAENCLPGNHDVYVAAAQIRRFNLRTGDYVKGKIRAQQSENQSVGLIYINEVNGQDPEKARFRKPFDSLIPVYPNERLRLERSDVNDPSMRLVDIIAPIGKGQRGMIVSQPKAGKTTLLKKIANAITTNAPEAHLIVLLIDERPEEVTDMKRSISGEVIYSTFDEAPENHTRVSEMVLERAQRLVELGKDVVILLDSITRLARAYNLVIPPTGRSLSGGLDPGALYRPKRFFGAARNIENGGSLTIIATALVDTGSRMDDIIFEEFKGTGNMELHLDRSLSERRIFPAVDVYKSGTRREDLLLTAEELEGAYETRRMLSKGNPQETYEQLISFILKTKDNVEYFQKIKGWMHAFDKRGNITK